MTITNENYKELLNSEVEFGHTDNLVFTIGDKNLTYYFASRFLANHNGWNDEIFKVLGLDKIEFCTKSYGYQPRSGDFPECCKDCRKCLRQVAYDLFEECEKYSLSCKSLKMTDISSLQVPIFDSFEEVNHSKSLDEFDDLDLMF